jgi:hypothetical protein
VGHDGMSIDISVQDQRPHVRRILGNMRVRYPNDVSLEEEGFSRTFARQRASQSAGLCLHVLHHYNIHTTIRRCDSSHDNDWLLHHVDSWGKVKEARMCCAYVPCPPSR